MSHICDLIFLLQKKNLGVWRVNSDCSASIKKLKIIPCSTSVTTLAVSSQVVKLSHVDFIVIFAAPPQDVCIGQMEDLVADSLGKWSLSYYQKYSMRPQIQATTCLEGACGVLSSPADFQPCFAHMCTDGC